MNAKRWIVRFLWLSAWCVWLWLGFGLYRELPRELGPVVCKLFLENGASIIGFVGETDGVAIAYRNSDGRLRVKVLNAESGVSRFDESLPFANELTGTTLAGIRHGVMIGAGRPKGEILDHPGLQALNLATSEVIRLPNTTENDVTIHPKKPWIVAEEGRNFGLNRVVVYDLRNGKELFVRPSSKDWVVSGRPFFIADDDAVVVPLTHAWGGSVNGVRFVIEISDLKDPAKLETTAENLPFGSSFNVSNSGRLLFSGYIGRKDALPPKPHWVDVFDLRAKEFLTSIPPSEQNSETARRGSRDLVPIISPNGECVLRGNPASLYEIGSGRVRWRPQSGQFATAPTRDNFQVIEVWDDLWRQWLPNLKIGTCAIRSLDTGELILRTRNNVTINPNYRNAAGTLVVLSNGLVHRLPLSPNWPLLALCQTILALPLILLWLTLLWRRRRIARRLVLQAAIP